MSGSFPKALEKGTAVGGKVEKVREVESTNPAWESRFEITLRLPDGHPFAFMAGRKTLFQQLGRMEMGAPEELVGGAYTFERTAEGFFNVLAPGRKVKPGTTMLSPVPQDAPEPKKEARNPNADFEPLPFDEPVSEARDAEEEKAKRLVLARLEVEGELKWALEMAEAVVRAKAGKLPVKYEEAEVDEDGEVLRDENGEPILAMRTETPVLTGYECRAMFALAATYHMSVKDKLRGY